MIQRLRARYAIVVDHYVGMCDALLYLNSPETDPVSYTHLTLPTIYSV